MDPPGFREPKEWTGEDRSIFRDRMIEMWRNKVLSIQFYTNLLFTSCSFNSVTSMWFCERKIYGFGCPREIVGVVWDKGYGATLGGQADAS